MQRRQQRLHRQRQRRRQRAEEPQQTDPAARRAHQGPTEREQPRVDEAGRLARQDLRRPRRRRPRRRPSPRAGRGEQQAIDRHEQPRRPRQAQDRDAVDDHRRCVPRQPGRHARQRSARAIGADAPREHARPRRQQRQMHNQQQVAAPRRRHERHQPRRQIGHAVRRIAGERDAEPHAVVPLRHAPRSQRRVQERARRQRPGQLIAQRERLAADERPQIRGRDDQSGEHQTCGLCRVVTASTAAATASARRSSPCGAMICIPTGSPAAS